jgi:hypothetical protein
LIGNICAVTITELRANSMIGELAGTNWQETKPLLTSVGG